MDEERGGVERTAAAGAVEGRERRARREWREVFARRRPWGWWEMVRAAPLMFAVSYGPALAVLCVFLLAVAFRALDVVFCQRLGPEWLHAGASWIAGRAVWFPLAFVLAYWLGAGTYRVLWRKWLLPLRRERRTPARPAAALRGLAPPTEAERGAMAEFTKIGIVLSGGGAKGVYQAGAMRAIHDHLARHGLLANVVSIAGTSIGSWNSLFWLTGMVAPDPATDRSPHEEWWTSYLFGDLVRPASFPVVPGLSSYLMRNEPWREEFARLFGRPDAPGHAALNELLVQKPDQEPRQGTGKKTAEETGKDEKPPCHFYLTRSNVLSGRLGFETNNDVVAGAPDARTFDMDQGRLATSVERIEEGVFTSMAIPPLFRYEQLADLSGSQWCEDGGVVDNLPLRLATAFDDCDLLFVIPLNSSFNVSKRPRQLATRLSRVIDVRQGVLERQALKLTYLFNIQRQMKAAARGDGEFRPTPAFVISPGQPLRIATTELWRSRRLRQAIFDQMRAATAQQLELFFEPGNLRSWFQSYADYATAVRKQQGEERPRLGDRGYLRMQVVDPGWEPGNPIEDDVRF